MGVATRARAVGAVAGLLLVSVVSGCSGGHAPAPAPRQATSDAAPSRLADLPLGDPPKLPYTGPGDVFLPGHTVSWELGHPGLRLSDSSMVAASTLNEERPGWSVHVIDARFGQPSLIAAEANGPAVISADGQLVAWPSSKVRQRAQATIGWTDTLHVSHRIGFPFRPTCCDNPFVVLAADSERRLYAFGGGTTWVAHINGPGDAGVARRTVRGLGNGTISEVGRHRVVVSDASRNGEALLRVGSVSSDGRFIPDYQLPGTQGTLTWSGRSLAYLPQHGEVRVRDNAGRQQTMGVPPVESIASLMWETTETLLVEVRNDGKGRDAWVRCRAATGECELSIWLTDGKSVPSR